MNYFTHTLTFELTRRFYDNVLIRNKILILEVKINFIIFWMSVFVLLLQCFLM